ncbi:MAG: NAD(P)/FAD-dependent oxidoreductase [Candidatus Eremiobacteraeota bacterium]|nr:NAD(P)/FAD-dependent oxidoreductase [Candidatus Eremiobacteraeota bacterium]
MVPSGSQHFDTIVIGAGPAGEPCAGDLATAGQKVAIVESERAGGECAFWACIPTKVLLRSAEPHCEAKGVPGSKETLDKPLSFARAAQWRTEMVSDYSDADHLPWLEERKIKLVRGRAVLRGNGRVFVDPDEMSADNIVIATGSNPSFPDIPGLRDRPVWTNREASAARTVPGRLGVLGGGPVGVEFAQIFARYGSSVTIIERSDRILSKESPAVSNLIGDALKDASIAVRCGAHVNQVRWNGDVAIIEIDGGSPVEVDRILVASGRDARVEDLGLDATDVRLENGHIKIDEHCKAGNGIWAVGDVTGVAMFTHVAKYQGHVAASNILGRVWRTNYEAVPRTVYCDPQAASVGLSETQAKEKGLEIETRRADLSSVPRSRIHHEDGTPGALGLLVERSTQRLVGAWAVGPMASEWIHVPGIAIAARLPVSVLRESIFAFPTFSEVLYNAAMAKPQ